MKHRVRAWAVAVLFLAAVPMAGAQQVHKATGVVTGIDRSAGKVTLKHDPIASLNWPGMTMAFAVKDKALLDKLAKDKKVEFELVQQGQQYVITSIK
ncbi:MAG TPA: copper-binding protein [Burkholderiales bacterium]|nr:copper-binding protein [Burkholderiales bacterium]